MAILNEGQSNSFEHPTHDSGAQRADTYIKRKRVAEITEPDNPVPKRTRSSSKPITSSQEGPAWPTPASDGSARSEIHPKLQAKHSNSQSPKVALKTSTTENSQRIILDNGSSGAEDFPQASRSQSDSQASSISHWVSEGNWPKEYFTKDYPMGTQLNKKRSGSTLNDPARSGLSDVSSREKDYSSPKYDDRLEAVGIYTDLHEALPTEECKDLCSSLLEVDQEIPPNTLFDDAIFYPFFDEMQKENEATVRYYYTQLIVPPVEVLVARGAKHLSYLAAHVDTAWIRAVPLLGSPPQPDYCVGFRPRAFSPEQQKRIESLVGVTERNPLMATYKVYFPFLTCEVKCNNVPLTVADRQNAHSASFAVNALISLYRAAGREKELDRRILAFSVSHDAHAVKIYGHYASLDGPEPQFYRYLITEMSLIPGGKCGFCSSSFELITVQQGNGSGELETHPLLSGVLQNAMTCILPRNANPSSS